jgi:asparagine synthase (glutamine-hydrolysing)
VCGIAGVLDFHGGPIDPWMLKRMTDVQRHRGPEGEGFHLEPGLGLGHRRLGIIGLGPAGNQPMANEDSTVWLVCNGEILNYRQLRHELLQRGHRFASSTDVEVILHLYEEHGDDCVKKLRGFFAFALWDARRRRLILVRDRVGQKPLVMAQSGSRVVFASEIKGVLASGCVPTDLDSTAVDLLRAYRWVPWPRTMFSHVHRVPPAALLAIESDGRISETTYWTPPPPENDPRLLQHPGEQLREALQDAARAQSISDVPMGALLSGGVDSSLTAHLVREVVGDGLQTFTVGYVGTSQHDPDLAMAREVSKHLGTVHHEVLVDDRMIDHLSDALWHWDEPYTNPVLLPHFELCRAMKSSVTVIHSGDGADELFGGYSGYAHWSWWHRASRMVQRARLSGVCNGLRPLFPPDSAAGKALDLVVAEPEDVRDIKYAHNHEAFRAAYTPELAEAIAASGPPWILREQYRRLSGGFLERLLLTDLLVNNAHGITATADAVGMASAVEIRSIFLDHHVVECAAKIPWRLKYRGYHKRKAILREVARPYLPPAVLARRKVGYGEAIPFGRLLRGPWRPLVEGVLFDGSLDRTGWFDRGAVRQLWQSHLDGRDQLEGIWMLLCIGLWHDRLRVATAGAAVRR